MRVILASASPRRKALLEQIGLRDFEIRPSGADESSVRGLSPADTAKALAVLKGETAEREIGDRDALILSADTVVELSGRILGKPRTAREAEETLALLSGRSHFVHTGLFVSAFGKRLSHVESVRVTFRALSEEEIAAYVATKEPMDKAGAYGIQGGAAAFVSRIEGDYSAVVGLPLCRLSECFRELGLPLFAPDGSGGIK